MDDLLPTADGCGQIGGHDELRAALLGLADGLVEMFMKPDNLGPMRVVINETSRFPQLGGIFLSAVPGNVSRRVLDILGRSEEGGAARVADAEAGGCMFVGSLPTYVIVDGLLAGEGPIRRPSADRVEAIVDLYLRAITNP